MFNLPDAKRVKRSELFSSISSSEDEQGDVEVQSESTSKSKNSKPRKKTEAEVEDVEHDSVEQSVEVDYSFDYEFVDKAEVPASRSISTQSKSISETKTSQIHPDLRTDQSTHTDQDDTDRPEQTYAFNLFAPKSTATTTSTQTQEPPTTTITLRSPTPPTSITDPSQGRLLKPRPLSHYFTSSLPTPTLATKQSQFRSTAITGSTLLSISHRSWPGTHLPWRIIHIPSSKSKQISPSHLHPQPPNRARIIKPHSRPRPSKASRIRARQRVAAREALKVASIKDEEAEREKRTRRNREKKVKKKLRDKAKKAAGGGENGGNGDEGADGGLAGEADGGGQMDGTAEKMDVKMGS